MDNSKCAILMPVARYIEPRTEDCLKDVEKEGYTVIIIKGASIDYARNILAARALSLGYEELFWIDSDMVFKVSDIEHLRKSGLSFVSSVCSKRSMQGGIACSLKNNPKSLVLGSEGGLVEIDWCGLAFVYTKKMLYETINKKLSMPTCERDELYENQYIPYFMPLVVPSENSLYQYLGEDHAFCYRAIQSGFRLYVDTRLRIGHIGDYVYSFEDIGGERPRYNNLTLEFN